MNPGSRRQACSHGKQGIREDGSGVSNVVGGVLFFALIILFLVVVRVQYVPVWEEDREADHMDRVREQFATFQGNADRQVDNRTQVPVTDQIGLGREGTSRFLSPARLPGSLQFEPDNAIVEANSSELRIFRTNTSTTAFGAEETWEDVGSVGQRCEIGLMQHLRARIKDPASLASGISGEKGNITLTITDANGDYAGQFRYYVEVFPSGYTVKSEVKNAQNETIYDQGESFFSQDEPALVWTNALADEVQFGDVLTLAESPYCLTFEEHGVDGEITIVYLEDDGSGVTFVGGTAAVNFPDWNATYRGGTLSYESRNQYFPEQTVHMANGAVVVEQEDGSVFLVEPNLFIDQGTSRMTVDVAIPTLTGFSDQASEPGTVPVTLNGLTNTDITATAPHLNLTYQTAHGELWAEAWRDAFESVGYSEASGHFSIDVSATGATLHIWGPETDPASDVHDLAVFLRQALIDVSIGP